MGIAPPKLFEPITLGNLTLAHRLWVAPMCQYSATDGMPGEWHLAHLGSFAIGRAALVMTEATAVLPEGRITSRDTGIWNDAQADAWARIVRFIHSQGVSAGIQLAHAGRKASVHPPQEGRGAVPVDEGGWVSRGPAALPYGALPSPAPLTVDEIEQVVAAYAAAARRARTAGFDLIEIHAAHGYLLHEFLSPLSNSRTDSYGSDETGRRKLLVNVVDAVRFAVDDALPVVVRLSASDWVPGGLFVRETAETAQTLEKHGVDLVSVSSGGNDHRQDIPVRPGYHVPLSRLMREQVSIPVGVAGLITSPQQAETVLVGDGADVIYVARQFLREPTFALRAAAELGGKLAWPIQYGMAKYAGSIP